MHEKTSLEHFIELLTIILSIKSRYWEKCRHLTSDWKCKTVSQSQSHTCWETDKLPKGQSASYTALIPAVSNRQPNLWPTPALYIYIMYTLYFYRQPCCWNVYLHHICVILLSWNRNAECDMSTFSRSKNPGRHKDDWNMSQWILGRLYPQDNKGRHEVYYSGWELKKGLVSLRNMWEICNIWQKVKGMKFRNSSVTQPESRFRIQSHQRSSKQTICPFLQKKTFPPSLTWTELSHDSSDAWDGLCLLPWNSNLMV